MILQSEGINLPAAPGWACCARSRALWLGTPCPCRMLVLVLLALSPVLFTALFPQDICECKARQGGAGAPVTTATRTGYWAACGAGALKTLAQKDRDGVRTGIHWCHCPQVMARLAEVPPLPVPAHPGSRAPCWPCLNVSLKGFAELPSQAVIWRLPFICSSVSGSRQRSLDL